MLQLSFESMLRAIDTAVSAEFEQKGRINHRAVLITPSDLINHPLDWEDDDGKARALAALGKRIEAVRPERYAVVGEAWMAPWPDHPALLRASRSDRRIEVVYIFLTDRSGQNCLATRPIETPHWARDPKRCLGPITFNPDMEGAFADLLGKQGGTNDE